MVERRRLPTANDHGGCPTGARDREGALNQMSEGAKSAPSPESQSPARGKVAFALFALYVIWGSTYLAMRYAIQSFPPFMMAGMRYLPAGLILWIFAKWKGEPWPTAAQWRASAIVGILLLVGGNGLVSYAQQWVTSSIAAVMIASTPIWASLFGGLFGRWPPPRDWLGLGLGLLGVLVLNLHGDLRAYPLGAVLLLLSAANWSLGSVWSRHLDLPKGFTGAALQMVIGGAALLGLAFVRGDRITAMPSLKSTAAVLYLIVFGSLVAYNAYQFLLRNVRPQLATSYAYVNPVIAVLLGVGIAGEPFGPSAWLGMSIILCGVVLVVMGGERPLRSRESPAPSASPGAAT